MLIYLKTETRKGHQALARMKAGKGAKGRGRQQGGELGLKGELNYSKISLSMKTSSESLSRVPV